MPPPWQWQQRAGGGDGDVKALVRLLLNTLSKAPGREGCVSPVNPPGAQCCSAQRWHQEGGSPLPVAWAAGAGGKKTTSLSSAWRKEGWVPAQGLCILCGAHSSCFPGSVLRSCGCLQCLLVL